MEGARRNARLSWPVSGENRGAVPQIGKDVDAADEAELVGCWGYGRSVQAPSQDGGKRLRGGELQNGELERPRLGEPKRPEVCGAQPDRTPVCSALGERVRAGVPVTGPSQPAYLGIGGAHWT